MLGAERLRVEGRERPLGVDRPNPRLSWEWTGEGRRAEFRLEVFTGTGERLWASPWARTPRPAFLSYAGPALAARSRYRWRVGFRSPDQRWASALAEFATGLMGGLPAASWISTREELTLGGGGPVGPRKVSGPPASQRPPRPVPEFTCRFNLERLDPSSRYVLRATALGAIALRVNGQPVSAEVLAPGWTHPAHTLPYQSVDVSSLLRRGGNEIAVRVGDGWAVGNLCWFGTKHYSPIRAVLVQLDRVGPGGPQVLLGTDARWSARETGTRSADLQDGCTRVLPERERRLEVITVVPPVASPTGQLAPPIVPIQRFPARTLTRVGEELVIDFGQNVSGWVELALDRHDGSDITVRHAEVLDADGALYTASLRSAQAIDEYRFAVPPAGALTPAPEFTVHGFRYAGITGLSPQSRPEAVAVAVSAELEQLAEFECSDPALNQLHSNVLWSARANLLSVPTDCPQRDERMGWTGDAQVFAATAALNLGVLEFFGKWLKDVRDAMVDGAVPNVAPDILSTSLAGNHRGTAGWGDAIVIVPWELYQAYGDRQILAENLEAMGEWLDYLQRHSIDGLRPAEGFGDWLAFDPTPLDLVATAFFAHSANLASRCARVLGDPREAVWAALAQRVRDAFRRTYLVDGELAVATQAAHLFALRFGLFDPAEQPKAAARLAGLVEANDCRLSTGFLATGYLLPVLSEHGYDELALKVLLGDSPPSWLYPIRHGQATTVWERWDSWTTEAGFQDPSMNSFNHYAYGAVDEWLCDRIGGIRRTAPGYANVQIAPFPSQEVTASRHSRRTPYGRIACSWRLEGDTLAVTAEIPDGITATFVPPAGYSALDPATECRLAAGVTEVVAVRRP